MAEINEIEAQVIDARLEQAIEKRLEKVEFKQRHNPKCREKNSIDEWHVWPNKKKSCFCPYTASGVLDPAKGHYKYATGKTSKADAEDQVRRWLKTGKFGVNDDPNSTPIKDAVDDYMEYVRKDVGAEESTIKKYQTLMDQFVAFAAWKGITSIQRFDGYGKESIGDALVLAFRRSWSDPNAGYKLHNPAWRTMSDDTAKRVSKTLRLFFDRCVDRKWIFQRPTRLLKFPKNKNPKTRTKADVKYLTAAQFTDIVWAVEAKLSDRERRSDHHRDRLKALIMVCRWGGLRISDGVALHKDQIEGDMLYIDKTKKSDSSIKVPLPKEALDALHAITPYPGGFYFCEGEASLASAHSLYSKNVAEIFTKAGIREKVDNKLTHRFRHTFVVDLLEKGVPLETVSLLIGHQSIKTTQDYYAGWTKGYMDRAAAMVRESWGK
jgi:site-specific recombinase XerD